MVKVRIINNVKSTTSVIDASTTIASAIESAGFSTNLTGSKWFCNGSPVTNMNATFSSLGGDSFDLTAIADQKNA